MWRPRKADRDAVSFEPEDLIAVIHSKYMVVQNALNATWYHWLCEVIVEVFPFIGGVGVGRRKV